MAVSHFCGQQRHAQVDGTRVGIHSGEVAFGVLGTGPAPGRLDVFGETASVAVRMAECAPTDSTIVSKTTQTKIQNAFLTERKGVVSVKSSRGSVETFFLKSKSNRHPDRRNQRERTFLTQTHTHGFSPSSLDVTADVLAGCAFPGQADDHELAFLRPSTDEVAAALQTSAGLVEDLEVGQLAPGTNSPTQSLAGAPHPSPHSSP